jgi:hypothetical protein
VLLCETKLTELAQMEDVASLLRRRIVKLEHEVECLAQSLRNSAQFESQFELEEINKYYEKVRD